YLHWMLRTMAYLKAPFWFFAAGTGDTVIAPLYELLRRRGVQFRFFHKVDALRVSADRSRIDSVELSRQATLISGGFDSGPLETVGSLQCWPATPRYEQLVEGDELRARHIDLESYYSGWPSKAVAQLVAGVDYHHLVFALSLGAVPIVCQ